VDNPGDFFGWLALQPPFLEVALGAFFCLIVAPTVLAGVAIAVTALESFAETQLTSLFRSRRAPGLSLIPRARKDGSGMRLDARP
jgi:hypothetical protein